MAELLLIVRLAGERVAMPASQVEAVVELEAITPVPRAAAHVKGLAALRSRVLTVIDCCAALGAGSIAGTAEAIIVPCDGHSYVLLLDSVEDVVEADAARLPLRAPLAPHWARVATHMIEAGGDLLLLVDPHALIAGPAVEAA
jgi:purine-binding chemotaxis protein CheW